ncbi:MSHA biogenesis protein MshI [Aliivibrio sp. 1S165]|uniref:MSHA biogenesis protein MshI n=1 Tax=unclassified Aliivibrio TaxID=2645654 RepID=UPI00080DB48C|nr:MULTISPECIES: MSHA biogenesis protein MshI [unclassified Aliivibrio]OCH13220.1 MSHA biogenesis protein MshI [Aliivibrio sp. 1S165]OCH28090.1 MSHA biogenesis protein MshI [Aliivibrio sp. 1S175]
MNIMGAFKKLKLSRSVKITTSIVIQQGGIYITKSDNEDELKEQHFTPIDRPNEWKEGIVEACNQMGLSDCKANIVVGSHLYQSFQIDSPNIPKEELAGALPFLVKDLISDRVTDIVADGVETSNGKMQVYISPFSMIKTLVDLLLPLSIEIGSITPDELVWGHSKKDEGSFMLLTYSKAAEFKLLAFNGENLQLNRSLRGIMPPLTGDLADSFQFDTLALELQRSLDYLSAQLHGLNINHLYVRCDDEDDVLLVSELKKRLGVQVAPLLLDEPRVFRAGELLGWLGLFHQPSVNLYSDKFKPQINYFSLQNIVISWGVGLLLASAFVGYYQYQLSQLNENIAQLSSEDNRYQHDLVTLNQRLESHKPSAAKLAAIKRLKEDVQSKKASLKVIDNFDDGMQIGYSGIMSSLTQLGKGNISLTKIHISGDNVSFTGFARSPDVVPNWVKSFENELHLVGRTFDQLEIKTDENGLVSFILNTKTAEGK